MIWAVAAAMSANLCGSTNNDDEESALRWKAESSLCVSADNDGADNDNDNDNEVLALRRRAAAVPTMTKRSLICCSANMMRQRQQRHMTRRLCCG